MDVTYLGDLRRAELAGALRSSPFKLANANVLEIGSGTGHQLVELRDHCGNALGVEIDGSGYRDSRVTDVIEYDGHHLPFDDETFDGIFSSNVMEHIAHFSSFQHELRRVVRKRGWAIHIVPTASWRFWTLAAHWPALAARAGSAMIRRSPLEQRTASTPNAPDSTNKSSVGNSVKRRIANALFPESHGEFGNRFTEIVEFHPRSWGKRFEACGWHVDDAKPTGLFYTGHSLVGENISFDVRSSLSNLLGSSCWTFYLRS